MNTYASAHAADAFAIGDRVLLTEDFADGFGRDATAPYEIVDVVYWRGQRVYVVAPATEYGPDYETAMRVGAEDFRRAVGS